MLSHKENSLLVMSLVASSLLAACGSRNEASLKPPADNHVEVVTKETTSQGAAAVSNSSILQFHITVMNRAGLSIEDTSLSDDLHNYIRRSNAAIAVSLASRDNQLASDFATANIKIAQFFHAKALGTGASVFRLASALRAPAPAQTPASARGHRTARTTNSRPSANIPRLVETSMQMASMFQRMLPRLQSGMTQHMLANLVLASYRASFHVSRTATQSRQSILNISGATRALGSMFQTAFLGYTPRLADLPAVAGETNAISEDQVSENNDQSSDDGVGISGSEEQEASAEEYFDAESTPDVVS